MVSTIATGKRGEKIALKHLQSKGYQLIKKNFSTRFGEVDLIVKKDDTLSFVEVKTSKGRGRPEWQISKSKIKRIKHMAQVFLATESLDYISLTIDIVCIDIKDLQNPQIRHYPAVSLDLF